MVRSHGHPVLIDQNLRTWTLPCQGAFLKGPSGAGCTMGMYCLARVLESRTCSHPTRLFSSWKEVMFLFY